MLPEYTLAVSVDVNQRLPSSDLSSSLPGQPFAILQSFQFQQLKQHHDDLSTGLTTRHKSEQDISQLTSSKSSPGPSPLPSPAEQQREEPSLATPVALSSEANDCRRTNQHDQRFGGAYAKQSLRHLTSASGATLKPGFYGSKVGLIMGLRTGAMDKYLGVRFERVSVSSSE